MITKTLENFYEQVKRTEHIGKDISFRNFDKILVCGMGGSGIGGYVLRDLVDMPVIVDQALSSPRWVDKNTLAFIVSYSGNTIEVIDMYRDVIRKTNKIVVITAGGKLGKVRDAIIIPGGNLPKNAFHYLLFPMLNVLRNSSVFNYKISNVLNAVKIVDKNNAARLASKIKGKIPIVYSDFGYYGTALRWKQNFNETSKQIAIANAIPEFFHNEIEGNYDKFSVIILEDKSEKRLEYFKKIVKCNVIKLKGKDRLAKSIYGIHTGDYTAYNLALLNKVDPDSEYRIDKLKEL